MNQIKSFGNKFVKHELIRGSFYIFFGFIASSFFAFLLNLYLARSLSSSDYGIYASLLSIIVLAGIPLSSVTAVIVRFATDYFAKGQVSEAAGLYHRSSKFVFLFSLSVCSLFILFLNPISDFLHFENIWYIILVAAIVFVQYLGIINGAFLQSLTHFRLISLFSGISGLIRLAFGVLLVVLGFKVFGALWAIFFAFMAPFLLGFIPLRFLFFKKEKAGKNISGKEIINYAIPTSIAFLSFVSLTSTDVILVRHFLSSHDAGIYGGISLVGKVIFYLTGPISSVMFPLLIKRHSTGKPFSNLFYLALFLVASPSLAITFFYFLFPNFSINFFLGKNYLEGVPYIGVFALYISVFSILNLFIHFFLSLKKTVIFIPVLISAILQIALISFFHSSFYQIIMYSLLVATLLLLTLFSYYLYLFGNFKKVQDAISFINNPRN